MKTQMRFQKILCLVSLILSAVAIVYAFAFFTGGLATISDIYVGFRNDGDPYEVYSYYYLANTVNDILLVLGIVYLAVVVFMYIFACNKRRNYYKDSVIVSIVAAAYIAVYAIVSFILIAIVHAGYATALDWDSFFAYEDVSVLSHTGQSPVMFILGYIFCVIALVNAAAIAFNLIWKLKLMKGEKELLANGLVKEVA